MEIKEYEQIILNDFEAQLQVLKGNLKITNEDLTNALAKKDEAQEAVAFLSAEIKEKEVELNQLNLHIESTKASINAREHSYEQALDQLKKDQESFEEEVSLKLIQIEDLQSKADRTVIKRKEEISKLDTEISYLTKRLEEANKLSEDGYVILNDLHIILNSLNIEKAHKEEELNVFRKQCHAEKQKLISELEQLSRLVQEEREKIKLPRENLEREQAELEVKRKDIVVLTNRLRRLYQELGLPVRI